MASDIESALAAYLAAQSSVTILLAAGVGGIYPVRADKDASLPVLVYQRVMSPSIHSKDGDMGLGSPHFQITCWASKYSEARAVMSAVRAALNAYVPPLFQGVSVDQIIVDNDGRDLDDAESLEFGRSIDAIFWVHE